MDIIQTNLHEYSDEQGPTSAAKSIFYDRHDGVFLAWMETMGLEPNASDDEIVTVMEEHDTTSIHPDTNHRS